MASCEYDELSTKTHNRAEYGDFQTPSALCGEVCKLLRRLEVSPKSIIEPTCGKGSFLRASVQAFPECDRILGFEINPEYVKVARTVERASIQCEDFFSKNWPKTLSDLAQPILVIGNPPWVTNAAVGTLGGTNLPTKSNFLRLNGFDAISGKSNFDISEWMLLHLLECLSLSGQTAVIAMLCKTVVARKVLHFAWKNRLHIERSAVYSIDAFKHFGAAVNACLLVCILKSRTTSQECAVHSSLEARAPDSTFAFRNGRLIANLQSIEEYGHLYGESSTKWRSGIKHDCSRVMELRSIGTDILKNGFGQIVNLEPTFLYPMLKSSELTKATPSPSRYMLVTQQSIGEDTSRIKKEAPRTWNYLEMHAIYLDKRSSSIYRNRPRFSIFGVGKYAFMPWKVAISGFYKNLNFRCIGPIDGKPVVLDDTCYFLPCQGEDEARVLADLLNSEMAAGFFNSFVFWDAKRPITSEILGNLDIGMLAAEMGISLPGFVGETFNLPFWGRNENIFLM